MDTTYAGDFPDGEVMHESLDGFRLEVQLKLTIRLILFGHMSLGVQGAWR